MPRSAEAPVSMFQAPLARAGASPHARGLGGRGWSPGAPLPLASPGCSWNAACGFAPLAARSRPPWTRRQPFGGRCCCGGSHGPCLCRRGRRCGRGRCGSPGLRGGWLAPRLHQLAAEGVDHALEGGILAVERGDHRLLCRGGGVAGLLHRPLCSPGNGSGCAPPPR